MMLQIPHSCADDYDEEGDDPKEDKDEKDETIG